MEGLHLTADLRGCPVSRPVMTDPAALRELCLRSVLATGLQPVGELFHRFTPMSGPQGLVAGAAPMGITGVVLLAESHLAVHTWPEIASVTLDVYVCNFGADNSQRAEHLLSVLIEAFAPSTTSRQALRRGTGVMLD